MGTDIEPINLGDGTFYVDTGDGRWQELKWLTEPLKVIDPTPVYTETAQELGVWPEPHHR